MSLVRIKRLSVIGALGTSAVFAVYDGCLFWKSRAPDEHLFSLHHLIVILLLATWIVADTTELRRSALIRLRVVYCRSISCVRSVLPGLYPPVERYRGACRRDSSLLLT